jgi:hypothetical protein
VAHVCSCRRSQLRSVNRRLRNVTKGDFSLIAGAWCSALDFWSNANFSGTG